MATITTKFNLGDYVTSTGGQYKIYGKVCKICYSADGIGYRVKTNSGSTFAYPEYELELAHNEVLDSDEKRYLENVIHPFKNEITYIVKRPELDTRYEHITLVTQRCEYINFPVFKKNTMYTGMEINKIYALDELGLFEEPEKCKRIFDF